MFSMAVGDGCGIGWSQKGERARGQERLNSIGDGLHVVCVFGDMGNLRAGVGIQGRKYAWGWLEVK